MTDGSWPFEPMRKPMEARLKTAYPGLGWAYEPKWDGFRILAWSAPVRLDSRNKKPLLRYFPELVPSLEALPPGTVVDGEVVLLRNDRLDFGALQDRLHPAASRVNKLAEETPASLVAFDLLALEGRDLRGAPFRERREALRGLLAGLAPPWHLTPSTDDPDLAKTWFTAFEAAGCDGLVAKDLDAPYVEGERKMVKLKHRRSVDVVVGGYRVHKDGGKIGSLLLGLNDDAGELHFIGHCSGFSNHDRVELLQKFEALRAEESFGEEARRPGGPSRWSGDKDLSWVPVEPGVVVQISYDQLTGPVSRLTGSRSDPGELERGDRGGRSPPRTTRFRHATRFERWRPDKDAAACTFDQLERPEGPGFSEVVAS